MSITSVNQASSGITPTNQSNQDSYEKNIQKQITRLQQEIKDIICDREKSSEEKASEKKTLQEQIQNLNSELKQYQVQKRTEEAAKKRETAAKSREISIQSEEQEQVTGERTNILAEEIKPGLSAPEAGVIISISNTKEQVLCMKKIRTGLEGRMRTADTEQEKLELQERINHVSQSMGEKVKKIADTIAENQRTEQERKDKVYEIQQEQKREREERREAMNVVLPTSRTNKTVETDRREENFVITGKVSVT